MSEVTVQFADAVQISGTDEDNDALVVMSQVGPPGPPGADGAPGPTGAAGPAGVDGNTVLYGAADPIAGQGVNGNFYINTTTHFIFGPKAAGAWPAGTSLIGPQGSTGPAGAAGPTGPIGPPCTVIYPGSFF